MKTTIRLRRRDGVVQRYRVRTRRKESKKSVYDMSSKEKVAELGFNADNFQKDLFNMDDEIRDELLEKGYSSEEIKKNVYPKLGKFKEKYKIDIPLGMLGVDVGRLDDKLTGLVQEKRRKEDDLGPDIGPVEVEQEVADGGFAADADVREDLLHLENEVKRLLEIKKELESEDDSETRGSWKK